MEPMKTNTSHKVPTLKNTRTKDGVDRVKILLVDDLKDNLLALEWLLKRDDLDIFKAKSGTEALEFMVLHDFAVAIIDVQMPVMSGFELAELMRGTQLTRNIPIIFVTATDKDQNFSFKGYESGAVDFLIKPLDTHAVKNKVKIFIELYQQRQELKKTQIELEKAVQIRDEFMSMASHELKTPLTLLKLHSQMRKRSLLRGDASAFTLEQLRKIFDSDEKQLDRINHLIDDMLDISRISSGNLSMRLERFDLCDLVQGLVERNSDLFVSADCSVQIEACESAFGNWDRFRIEQVIMNLLTNAMRYGAKKPILVQVNTTLSGAQITVRDQGRGIAKENHARIFQKFERAAIGSGISGLGLGLYIVKQIVEAHHGSIRVESELDQGATFLVELPLLELNEELHRGL